MYASVQPSLQFLPHLPGRNVRDDAVYTNKQSRLHLLYQLHVLAVYLHRVRRGHEHSVHCMS